MPYINRFFMEQSSQIYSGNSFNRGLQKFEQVLKWIYTWHFTSIAVLVEHMKIKPVNASNLLGRLVRQNYLQRVECEALQGADLFMLTVDGLEEAENIDGRLWDYDLRAGSINHNNVRHDIGVQWLVANALHTLASKKLDVVKLEPDHVLRSQLLHQKIPDCRLTSVTGMRVSVEFERSEKAGEKLDRFIYDIYQSLTGKDGNPPAFDLVQVFARSPALICNYQRRLNEAITLYARNKSTNRWEVKTNPNTNRVETLRIPDSVKDSINFFHKPEIAAAISPMTWRKKAKAHEVQA